METPERHFDVVENGSSPRRGHEAIVLGEDISFSTDALRAYAFARWEPVIYDALVVAAAIDFADKTVSRSVRHWPRQLSLRIPVHEVERWKDASVSQLLLDAVGFLTGDNWEFEFVARRHSETPPAQEQLDLPAQGTVAVIPYSNGMDSKAVAGIIGAVMGDSLLRVRLGTRSKKPYLENGKVKPFTAVPYSVSPGDRARESSGRSRGFRFAMVSGVAAYLSEAQTIIVPESGQGAIGPALVTVGGTYQDFRNHPRFTVKMEKLLHALLGCSVCFSFPRIWSTKSETLKEFLKVPEGDLWAKTKSCWYDNRQSSVDDKFRHCGACAACMLRRMSVLAAGLEEDRQTYKVVDLRAESLESAVASGAKVTASFEEYALAGTLSLAQLAGMFAEDARPHVRLHAVLMAAALGERATNVEENLRSLLMRHKAEWDGFLRYLGPQSFVAKWVEVNDA